MRKEWSGKVSGSLLAILSLFLKSAARGENGYWHISQLPIQNGVHASINNSSEIVWAVQGAHGIFSTTRGMIASSGYNPHLANDGEVLFADIFEGPNWDLVSNQRGRLTHGGLIDINLSDFDLNAAGEVVYVTRDVNNYAQVFSTVRGQITSDPSDHYNPSINDLGEVIWTQFVFGEGTRVVSETRGVLEYDYGTSGLIGSLDLNNFGEFAFTGSLHKDGGYWTFPHIFSTTHGAVIGDPDHYEWGSAINDAGKLLWSAQNRADSAWYFYEAEWIVVPEPSFWNLMVLGGTLLAVRGGSFIRQLQGTPGVSGHATTGDGPPTPSAPKTHDW